MISDGYLVGDGSWELSVFVTDLDARRVLRVKGDLHVGGVMLKLVEDLGVANDWSDHALWWPEKNMWLSRTRSTLDQYGVQADAILYFTPMHKILRLQLPDLRFVDVKVDFSIKTFTAVINVAKILGIRHPEEMSFCRPLMPQHLKKNHRAVGCSPRQRGDNSALSGDLVTLNDSPASIHDRLGYSSPFPSPPMSPWNANQSYSPCLSYNGSSSPYSSYTLDSSFSDDAPLAHSPSSVSDDTRQLLLRPKTLAERARLNCGWLDSSLSLMEQDVRELDILLLRYKYYSFFDLNPKFDAVRINQIYEQAKWSILTEEIDCTEEEMMMFAALQYQVNLQAQLPQPDIYSSTDDDIDAALTDLQVTLEGTSIHHSQPDITYVPELSGFLRFMKPKKFTLKNFKRYFFTFKDTQLSCFRRAEDVNQQQPSLVINLKGCEVTPDVNISQMKYGIKLEVPSHDGMLDYLIRCEEEEQYAKWMAAFRLAAKGRTMADSSYSSEVKSILDFLSMQRPAPSSSISPPQVDISPDFYIAPRFLRKLKGKQVVQRILEAHTNVKELSLVDAKLSFIKAWQALPEFGISLFIVKFCGSKKEELLGVAFNRIMRMDLNSGDHIKTWRYNTMKAWNVNWEVRQMMVQFEEENIAFSCLSADCKVVHEFIGGYIFLSMRSKDQNQTLNEELYHKLTGGWS